MALGFNLGFSSELLVASYPVIEASLYIDGRLVGETPLNITLKPGKYRLKAEKEGFLGEKEIIVEEPYTFVNVFMRKKDLKSQEEGGRTQKTEEPPRIVEIPKIEPPEVEISKREEPQEIKEELIRRPETPRIEPPKIEPPKPKEDIQILILKVSSLIEEAENEGAERYAKERIRNAKRLLSLAKKENSLELIESAYKEAGLALKETKERISHYNSSYLTKIFKNIGK